jgi:hypothetical protein
MCTEERKPHKHAAVIKAWADGAIIQYLSVCGDWRDVMDNRPLWGSTIAYRVKPTPKRTVGYRRYAHTDSRGTTAVCLLHQDTTASWNAADVEKVRGFVRWIDTEWQYYEWEE